MAEAHADSRYDGSPMLDVGTGVGALLVHTTEALAGHEVEVSPGSGGTRVHTVVRERTVGGRRFFAALFPALAAGHYTLWSCAEPVAEDVAVVGGTINEVRLAPAPG